MKNLKLTLAAIILGIIFFGLSTSSASACEIDFNVVGDKKDKYEKNEELIIKVTVFYTHRNCPEGIDATKFKTNGIKVVQATKWKEITSGTWERKLKVKIIDTSKGEVTINATRTCDKEGGFGVMKLKTK